MPHHGHMTTYNNADPFGFAAAINWDVVEEHADEISEILERMND